MKIIRTIVPVGIGAFCIERFIDEHSGACTFLVVYDCGKGRGASTSLSLKQLIDLELGMYGKTVDFLFLSHFDNDHINGLSYLIKTSLVNNVDTTVFLPLVQVPHIYLYEYINNLRLFDTENLLKKHGIKIGFVRPDKQNEEAQVKGEREHDSEHKYYDGVRIIDSYSTLHPSNQEKELWRYIPFYLQDNGIYIDFLTYINTHNPYGIKMEDFHSFLSWPDYIKSWLKRKYISYRYRRGRYDVGISPINMNAILLISDKAKSAQLKRINIWNAHLQNPSCFVPNLMSCSALYTSDVGLNSTLFFHRTKFAICNHIDGQIAGLFQIPHHGSTHCYNRRTFTQMPFQMAFCNCIHNSLNPAYCIQYELDANNSKKPYAIVDNNPNHRFDEEIWIW